MNRPDDAHEALRARIAATDPFASGAGPEVDNSSVEVYMSQLRSTPDTPAQRTASRRWAYAAAAVLLVGAGVGVALANRPGADLTATTGAAPSAQPPLALQLPADGAARKCAMVTAEVLRDNADGGFSGSVTSIAGGRATLAVDHWYAGTDRRATVSVAVPAADLTALIGAPDFTVGERFLVATSGPDVLVCAMTAPYSAELAGIYESAF